MRASISFALSMWLETDGEIRGLRVTYCLNDAINDIFCVPWEHIGEKIVHPYPITLWLFVKIKDGMCQSGSIRFSTSQDNNLQIKQHQLGIFSFIIYDYMSH